MGVKPLLSWWQPQVNSFCPFSFITHSVSGPFSVRFGTAVRNSDSKTSAKFCLKRVSDDEIWQALKSAKLFRGLLMEDVEIVNGDGCFDG